MSTCRFPSALIAVPALALCLGCASAGPDLNGPGGPAIMEAYSGDWVFDPAQSDDLEREMRAAMRGPAAGGMGGQRPGGGGGGRPGGGGMGGARPGGGAGGGMMGGDVDPEEMMRQMEAVRSMARAPAELSLVLRPGSVTYSESASSLLILGFDAEREEIPFGETRLFASARWLKRGIEIRRELPRAGGVKDEFSLDEAGNLILKREVDLMAGRVEAELVYRRRSG